MGFIRSESTSLKRLPVFGMILAWVKLLDITKKVGQGARDTILIPLLVAFKVLIYQRLKAFSIVALEDLEQLSLTGANRILIVAPHPDDETLGAGGLIQVARDLGIKLKVVVMTNGEGQRLGPLALTHRIRLRDADFVALGERRQLETVAATKQLGLEPGCVSFLGYPDRSLYRLWLSDWREKNPLRSAYTRADYSPYSTTYNPESIYRGWHVLQDLQTLIAGYQPDIIVMPHMNDDHPDHRATANFVRMAACLQSQANADFQPQMWAYLIHYGSYPRRRGNLKSTALLPPRRLSNLKNQWVRLDLNADQIHNKHLAIKRHASQVVLLGNFLSTFVQSNELFSALPKVEVSPIALNTVPLLETGVKEQPKIYGSPTESHRKRMLGGADMLGWRVARLGDSLYLTVDTRGQLLSRLQYRILLKFSDGSTRTLTPRSPELTMRSTSITTKIDLAEMPDPPLLAFAAEVSQGMILDQTGWYFLHIHGWWD
jgi:LmbE family N-acetylglucosaminyl deacetylase